MIWTLKENKDAYSLSRYGTSFCKICLGSQPCRNPWFFCYFSGNISYMGFVVCIREGDSDAIICAVGFLFLIGLALVCFHLKPTYKDVMTYQVTLDDTYSYNQLVEQYDIIETKGQILTIREKGWDDDIPKEGD